MAIIVSNKFPYKLIIFEKKYTLLHIYPSRISFISELEIFKLNENDFLLAYKKTTKMHHDNALEWESFCFVFRMFKFIKCYVPIVNVTDFRHYCKQNVHLFFYARALLIFTLIKTILYYRYYNNHLYLPTFLFWIFPQRQAPTHYALCEKKPIHLFNFNKSTINPANFTVILYIVLEIFCAQNRL